MVASTWLGDHHMLLQFDPSPEKTTSLEVLYKLQKRAARIIRFVHHLTYAEPLFRKLNILLIYMTYANVKL